MKGKDKMKVLISILGFSQGGAEIMPIRIANQLKENGYKVAVHSTQKEEDPLIRNMLNSEIPVYHTCKFWRMALIIIKNRFTIIHTHSIASQQLIARMKRRLPFINIRHIATSHGGYEGMNEKEALDILKCVDPAVDVWTCVADNNRNLFQHLGIPDEKIYKVGNSMKRPSVIQKVDWHAYGIDNITDESIVICTISRAVWKKSWRECIASVTEARNISGKDIQLVLAGTGPIYDELIQEKQESFIHLIGAVDNPCDLYYSSKMGLLLSKLECAPLGIIEMYYAGVPLVATDTGDIREMMGLTEGNVGTGLIVELENGEVPIKKAAETIVNLITDQSMYNVCKQNAIEKSKEYDMNKVTGKYISIYK